jgi:hypothetical protein
MEVRNQLLEPLLILVAVTYENCWCAHENLIRGRERSFTCDENGGRECSIVSQLGNRRLDFKLQLVISEHTQSED